MRRRNQPHLVAERGELATPMVRRAARLHRHQAWRQLSEEGDKPTSRQLARNHDLALPANGVNLKSVLPQIEPNPRDNARIPDKLAHGRLPFRWGFDNDHLGTLMPFGAPSTPSWKQTLPKPKGCQGAKPACGGALKARP